MKTHGRRHPHRRGSLGEHLRGRCGCRLLLLLVVERAAEQHDVRLRPVDRVVHPPAALLNTDRTPLVLQQGIRKEKEKKKIPTKPQHQTTKNRARKRSARMQVKLFAFTSERRRFLGRSLATSDGRTTCLRRQKGIGLGFCQTRRRK